MQGYEKSLGTENTTIYIPELNPVSNLGSLFECQADLAKAETMYSKALLRYDTNTSPVYKTNWTELSWV